MRDLTIEIPVRPMSLNWERTQHWATVREHVTSARDAAYLVAKVGFNKAKIGAARPVMGTVEIVVQPWAKDRRYRQDIGNCYPTAKAAIDGLVLAGLIDDDDDRHLTLLSFRPHRYGRDALELFITEVDTSSRGHERRDAGEPNTR